MARILVVDDDRVIRGLLEINLGMEGHDVVTAADGQEALDYVSTTSPDLVLLDVMMPRLNGWQVAERMKEDESTACIPIIFLSARAMEVDLRKGQHLGVDQYVTKPFDPIDLMELVNRLVADPQGRKAL